MRLACAANYFTNGLNVSCAACPAGSSTNFVTGSRACSRTFHASMHLPGKASLTVYTPYNGMVGRWPFSACGAGTFSSAGGDCTGTVLPQCISHGCACCLLNQTISVRPALSRSLPQRNVQRCGRVAVLRVPGRQHQHRRFQLVHVQRRLCQQRQRCQPDLHRCAPLPTSPLPVLVSLTVRRYTGSIVC